MKGTERRRRAQFPCFETTEAIIGCFYRVYNALGYGFLERVYVRALAREMRDLGLAVDLEVPLPVFYADECVGAYRADCVVEASVIVEVKAVRTLAPEHGAQLLHYLRSTDIEVGLLLNFGNGPTFKRLAYSNNRKADR